MVGKNHIAGFLAICTLYVRSILLGLALFSVVACGRNEAPTGRVLVIAVDGADLGFVTELMAQGRLPHLAAIAEAGSSGVSRPNLPLLSPRIWTDVVTGKLPGKHGIEGWVWLDDGGAPHLYSSRDRKVPALWNILSHNGRSTGVVNWLMTHPPEKIHGIMVSDHAAEGDLEGKLALARGFADRAGAAEGEVQIDAAAASFVYPESFGETLAKSRSQPPLTSIPNPFGDPSVWDPNPITAYLRQVHANDEFAAQLALEIEREIRPDLLLVYLPGIDRMSHFLFDAVVPLATIPEALRRPDETRERHAIALRSHYEYIDQLIGRLVQERGQDDLILVVSDHGFEVDTTSGSLKGVHDSPAARDGILFAAGRGVPRGRRDLVLRLVDITPTILAWFGLPPANDMQGKPASFLEGEIADNIASYDATPIERLDSQGPSVESKIIENLKELGYVDE